MDGGGPRAKFGSNGGICPLKPGGGWLNGGRGNPGGGNW